MVGNQVLADRTSRRRHGPRGSRVLVALAAVRTTCLVQTKSYIRYVLISGVRNREDERMEQAGSQPLPDQPDRADRPGRPPGPGAKHLPGERKPVRPPAPEDHPSPRVPRTPS